MQEELENMKNLSLAGEKIMFLSEGDIRYDSRILKSINVATENGAEALGFGIIDRIAPSQYSRIGKNAKIFSINLVSRKVPFKLIRYICAILEYNFKGLFFALKHRPSLIHCNDYVPLPLAIIIKILLRSKILYDAHELESHKHGQSKLTSILVFSLEFLSWSFIDSFVTVSESIKNWYLKKFPKKASCVVLNTPFFKNNLIYEKTYLRKKFKIPENYKVFIYVGVLTKGRCLFEIIDCFKQEEISKRACLVFLGSGPLKEKLFSMVTTDNLIFFHRPVAPEEVLKITSSADYGIRIDKNESLSHEFSLPNKIFEYIFAGIPLITAPNHGDVSNLIETLKLGIICEPNLESMKKAIKKMMSKKIKFDIDSNKLYPYSWDCQSKNLLKNYIKILNK